MTRPGIWRDDHPRASHVHPPAEAQVVLEEGDPLVEAPDLGEHVAAYQRAAARNGEDVAHAVVLFLVELVTLDEWNAVAGLVDALTELQDPARPVPPHQLRADDSRVGAVRLLDQHSDRVGVERHVVVAEEVERGTLDDVENLVGGRTEARVRLDAANECRRSHRRHPILDRNRRPRVENEHGEVRVVLLADGLEALLEPRSGGVRDDHRDHCGGCGGCGSGDGGCHTRRGRAWGGAFHDRSRLAGAPSRSPAL